ncbi:MAG: phosphatidylglycerophosphatase A [Syntrophobacteraceae bacterium]|nr:phosphatidylglycerophosphatase A [Syntrophobacteraceae bacterium]
MNRESLHLKVATLGVLGRSPHAPGTLATLAVGVPSAFLLGFLPLFLSIPVVVTVVLVGFRVSETAEKVLQKQDSREIVIDELAGYLVTMILLPVSWKSLLLGFAAFRLFDIWKPWPVNLLQDRLKGGAGVVMDDVGAGVYACALVWLALRMGI